MSSSSIELEEEGSSPCSLWSSHASHGGVGCDFYPSTPASKLESRPRGSGGGSSGFDPGEGSEEGSS